jgi:hypothetical protein
MIAQHSKVAVEWGTPHAIVELAREVMGGIDADPCSSKYWNEHVVKAKDFYTEANQLLVPGAFDFSVHGPRSWLVNPPGGLVKEFWRFALDRWKEGSAVFWVGFSLNQMTYLGKVGLFAPQFVRAVPFQRTRYLSKVEGGPPVPGDAPPHGSYLCLMPSAPEQVERFRELAAKLPAAVF